MKQFFYLVALALIIVCAPYQVHAQEQTCTNCEDFKRGVNPKLIPSHDARCVPFTQSRPGKISLFLTLKDGGKRTYTKNAGKDDCIMVGRHWLRNKTVSMIICNDEYHADYPIEDVLAVASQSKMSRANEACLSGREICKDLGYKISR